MKMLFATSLSSCSFLARACVPFPFFFLFPIYFFFPPFLLSHVGCQSEVQEGARPKEPSGLGLRV